MKKILLLSCLFLLENSLFSQTKTLSIIDCYKLAETNYPLTKQRDLIAKTKEYSVDNVSKGILPQINVSGQGTYQSDVTEIPIKIPGIKIESVPKDQYKLYGEISQPLTDLVTIKDQKEFQNANSAIQDQNLTIELYKLRDKVNQLFFGALLIDEQNTQNEILKKDIQSGIDRITAAIQNGVEYKSSMDKLKAELLRANQRSIELQASRKAYTDMLSLIINQNIDENIRLEKPATPSLTNSVNRPELFVFDFQKKANEIQRRFITAKNMPRVNLFFQGGLGQPSPVNMLSNELSSYYITGIRLNWNITGFYTFKKERQLNSINVQMIDAQKETFLFNINLTLKQQNAEIEKLSQLLKTDDEIVSLRESVKKTASIQLENGVITSNDYLKEINAEDQARQNRLLHQVQLLMAQYNYQNTSGN